MSGEDAQSVKLLLAMKFKSTWTEDERKTARRCLEKEGTISVLAACCILFAKRSEKYRRALHIIGEAMESQVVSTYVELSMYEALIQVKTHHLARFYNSIIAFVERSLSKRAVNLDNTVALLGNLARSGEPRALALLKSLAGDHDPGVRNNASLVLRGIVGQ